MPVKKEFDTHPQKFILYYSDTIGGDYKRSKRTNVLSFRKQSRSLGSGSATYFPANVLNDTEDVKSKKNKTKAAPAEELKPGMFVKILDGTKFWDSTYGSVGDELFIGVIRSVTNDIFEGSVDRTGVVIFDEIGHYYSTLPILWSSQPQVFNPVIDDICYGNKDPNELAFETDVADMVTASKDGKFETSGGGLNGNNRVWSLQQMLEYMGERFGFEVTFPWESLNNAIQAQADKDIDSVNKSNLSDDDKAKEIIDINTKAEALKVKNETSYLYFKQTLDPRSFAHYEGKSVPFMLSELIEEPFGYYITASSSSVPQYVIYNKAAVEVLDVCPAGNVLEKSISANKTEVFNITEDSEVYDRIVYRGNNLLFCGSITPWIYNGANSLKPDWTLDEELKYTRGTPNNTGEAEKEILSASSYRMDELSNVYRKLKFAHYDEDGCYFRIPKATNASGVYTQAPYYPSADNSQYAMVPFFPRVDFYTSQGDDVTILVKPKIYNDIGLHKSPAKLEFSWAEKLPIRGEKTKTLKDPFAIAKFELSDSDPSQANTIAFQSITDPGGSFQAQIQFEKDGISIVSNPNECLASNNRELFFVSGSYIQTTKRSWKPEYVSVRNPATTSDYTTSWESVVLTVAAYSGQRLEVTIDRPKATTRNKIKIIEDDTLEAHIVHAGTIKKLKKGPFEVAASGTVIGAKVNGFERYQKDTFLKNDFPLLLKLAKQAANWLFTEKRAVRIEEHLVLHTIGSWSIGDLVGKIKDGQVNHTINSTVESIEFDCVMNRCRIATSFPQMPEFKRLSQQPISASNIAPVRDSRAATLKPETKIIKAPAQPVVGQVSSPGSVNATALKVPVITVLNGSATQAVNGIDTIKVVTGTITNATEITGPASDYVDGETDFPDGLGVGRLATDGSIVWVANTNPYLPYALYGGDRFISTSTVPVGGGTIPDSNPPEKYYFEAYVPEVIL